jgi:FolB domain-containing protein
LNEKELTAMAKIRIEDLHVRAIIGTNDWERKEKQDVLINITIQFDAGRAAASDDIKDTLDYKTIAKNIIAFVEGSQFFLLERLVDQILRKVMDHDMVQKAKVRADKPQALRFAKTVSVEMRRERKSS